MATPVQIRSTRTVIYVNGVQTFRVEVLCVDKGSMPDTHLFLLNIVDEQDPQQDVFERIVELADLDSLNPNTGYKPNRAHAIGDGKAYWRSDTFTIDYTDIEVAKQAVTAIADRLNTLVDDFTTYDTAFKTDPTETAYYPSTDATTIETLKTAYTTAYTAYETAQTDLATAQAAVTTAETDLSDAETALSEWTDFEEGMQNAKDILNDVRGAFELFVKFYAKPFVSCVDEFTDDYIRRFGDYQQATRKLTFVAGSTANFTDGDIGATVTVDGGSDTATLIGFDNTIPKTILINPAEPIADNPFDGTHPKVYLSTKPGAWWDMDGGSTLITSAANAPNIQKLIACRDRFSEYRLAADEEVSVATTGVTSIDRIRSDVAAQVSSKTSALTAARAAVTTAQEDLSKARADLQTAYDSLETAYNAVKTVCPNWSPDDAFPPLPSTA